MLGVQKFSQTPYREVFYLTIQTCDFKKYNLFILLLEKGSEREREGEKH